MAMRISQEIWNKLATHAKSCLVAKFDPTLLIPTADQLKPQLEILHKGFYIGVENSSNQEVCQVGFLKEDCSNVFDSLNRVLEATYSEMQAKSISVQTIKTGKLYFEVILDLTFIENGLNWDVNTDGVYFSWGDRYKGFWLPYQVKKMIGLTQVEIMNRLCSHRASVVGNLWRLPEGLIWKLTCDSYSL